MPIGTSSLTSFFSMAASWTREVVFGYFVLFSFNFGLEFRFGFFKMTETMQLRGTLRGHNGWVTQIATNPIHTDMILSCSRGKFCHHWLAFGLPFIRIFIDNYSLARTPLDFYWPRFFLAFLQTRLWSCGIWPVTNLTTASLRNVCMDTLISSAT